MEKRIYVKVPLEWLEGLNRQVNEFDKDSNPKSLRACALIGYASSAENIIEHNERFEE